MVLPEVRPAALRWRALYFRDDAHVRTPDVFTLPEGADVTVELYGGACSLWLDGERGRVHMRRFDYLSFQTVAVLLVGD